MRMEQIKPLMNRDIETERRINVTKQEELFVQCPHQNWYILIIHNSSSLMRAQIILKCRICL